MFKEPNTAADFDKAYDLICQLHMAISCPIIDRDEYERRLRIANDNGYRQVLFIDNEEITGVLGFRVLSDLTRPKRLLIDELVIDSRFRGKGHSQILLGYASKVAREHGCVRVDLEVVLKNVVALNAYEKQDYEKIAYLMKKVL